MKKLAVALAVCGSLICSPVEAKTFVGVLWPMFGPLPAIGLVELVAELKSMPDVEVQTYVHQAWPSLVDDIKHLPPGTHTLVVGYSLGANSSVFVANNSNYIDTIIALQPSMLSWNPEVTGKVGHYIEIYNPNPWETFGGMGSKKLIGANIEYVANNDSHPGAQFDPQFRDRVKSEVAKLVAEDQMETAQAETPKPIDMSAVQPAQIIDLPRDAAAKERAKTADTRKPAEVTAAELPPPVALQRGTPANDVWQGELPKPAQAGRPALLERVADEEPPPQPLHRPKQWTAFLDSLTGSVDSGDLFVERHLTRGELMAYAKRTYTATPPYRIVPGADPAPRGSDVITTASLAFDRSALAGRAPE